MYSALRAAVVLIQADTGQVGGSRVVRMHPVLSRHTVTREVASIRRHQLYTLRKNKQKASK